MNRKELAHLWAHKARPSGRASSFYFEGDKIYSYGSHFVIARHHKGAVLITTRTYSNTTARHISAVRSACSHMEVFNVERPENEPNAKDLKNYQAEIDRLTRHAVAARTSRNSVLDWLKEKVDEANRFSIKFGFKTRFNVPDDFDELRALAKKTAEFEARREADRQRKIEAAAQEAIQKWLAGEQVSIPFNISRVYLRRRTGEEFDMMQTSKGAVVPLAEAERAFKFCMKMREKGWHRNGEQFKVGAYQLDAVNSDTVVAGCHIIEWQVIMDFAKQQGWIK